MCEGGGGGGGGVTIYMYFSPAVCPQASSNVVVVQAQPQATVTSTVFRSGSAEFGIPALIFAVAITICLLSLGCWYAILCSGIAIALAAGVSPPYCKHLPSNSTFPPPHIVAACNMHVVRL